MSTSTNLRLVGSSISRLLVPTGFKTSSPLKLAPVGALGQLSPMHRRLHNRTLTPHQQVVSSVSPMKDTFVPLVEFKLDEMKVFQDEQIIQLCYKSGQTVNYTMSWLRNLCTCSACVSSKFNQSAPKSGLPVKPASLAEGELSVARFSSTEDELLIEWLDTTQYKSHVSTYNLKYLSLYANTRN